MFAFGPTGAAHLYSMPVVSGTLGDKGALEKVIERFKHPDDASMTRPPVLGSSSWCVGRCCCCSGRPAAPAADLKIANVLYHAGRTPPDIWLCDFGSAMLDDDDKYTFTYPNPPSGRPFQPLQPCATIAALYQVGVLLLLRWNRCPAVCARRLRLHTDSTRYGAAGRCLRSGLHAGRHRPRRTPRHHPAAVLKIKRYKKVRRPRGRS